MSASPDRAALLAQARALKPVIQCQLKLVLRPAQERLLERWLWHLTGVYNWTIRKLELDARDGIFHSRYDLDALVARHGRKVGVAGHTLAGTVFTAHDAWMRYRRGISGKPRLKGRRHKLNHMLFRYGLTAPVNNRVSLCGFGRVKVHPQAVPDGLIKSARLVRRASGWYLCLFIHAEPNVIPHLADREVGIDPGFNSLLTLSSGEKVDRAAELSVTANRLAQAQRGGRRRLTARLQERIANRRKDRNQKLSRRLVSEHALIVWSKDNHRGIARKFGKSVASAAHGQLRTMLAYKCRPDDRRFVEVSGRYSTVTCSACGDRSGPTGWASLKVRFWRCGCGAEHDRDINAAVVTLQTGRGMRLERAGNGSPGIAA